MASITMVSGRTVLPQEWFQDVNDFVYGQTFLDSFLATAGQVTFTLTSGPIAQTTVIVDGLVQNQGTDYIVSGKILTFSVAPGVGAEVVARYIVQGPTEVDGDTVSFIQSGTGAIARSVQNKERDVFSVKDFGVIGNGVADDTAGLIAAEAAAFAVGAVIYLPLGTYLFDGSWSVRVNVLGYGATIKQKHSSVIATEASGVFVAASDGITVSGLTVDGNFKTTGFASTGINKLTFRDCVANNCVNMAFTAFGGDDLLWERCRATVIRYSATGAAGLSADGFYVGGATKVTWQDCTATDFRRIGFVSEAYSGAKSDYIVALRCTASNANNCDDSTSEYNAAFWAENTNNVDFLYCVGTNLAGNAGQTSGRVYLMTLLGGGNSAEGQVRMVGCRLYGTSGYASSGVVVISENSGAEVLIQDCTISKARCGVLSSATMVSLTISRIYLISVVNLNAAQAGILVDGTGSQPLPLLTIDQIYTSNCTFNEDSGLVLIYAAPTGCTYKLSNVIDGVSGGVSHVMRSAVSHVITYNCEIAAGSTTFQSFLADTCEFNNTKFISRNSSDGDYIVPFGRLNDGSKVIHRGGEIVGYGSGWMPLMAGTDIDLVVDGTRVDNYCFQIQTNGTFLNKFHGAMFYNVPPTNGVIRTNGGGAATKQTLIVQNCFFTSNDASDTPIRKQSNDPTKSILHNNVYDTATNLHDFTSPTSVENNIST